jgi:Lrp/AsnC family transcriptional regulator, leucine-responsive regulatory protein
MDDKDRLLLTLLKRDARRPVVALARDIGLSRSATQDRLARLQASGAIAGFTLAEGSAGEARETAWLTVRFEPRKRCADVVPKLKRIPAIASIHSVSGAIDLVLRVEGENVAAIEATRSAIDAVPGIADVSTYIVLERHLG